MLYFDHGLTTQPKAGVVEKMAPFFQINWLSPVAPYSPAKVQEAIEEAEKQILSLLGQKGHLVFTSSGAEAVNHVVMSTYIDVTRKTGKNHFLTTNLSEAPSILAMTRLQEMGCLFDMVRVDPQLTKEAVIESLTPRTALLSVSLGCGVTGVFQRLEGIYELCQERGVLLHVDVTHLLDKVPLQVEADFITFNGEQIGGPKATGALLIKEGVELSPFILGGNEQGGMRGGSLNVPAFVGLGEACRQVFENRDHAGMETASLRAFFEKQVLSLLPDTRIVLRDEVRLPHVSCMIFPGVKSDALAYSLAQEDFFACIGGGNFQQIHYLLKALKMDDSHCGLSFSFSPDMGQEQLLKGAKLLFETVAKLRRYSESL